MTLFHLPLKNLQILPEAALETGGARDPWDGAGKWRGLDVHSRPRETGRKPWRPALRAIPHSAAQQDRMSGVSMTCSPLPSHAWHPCWKAWVSRPALSLDSNTLLPRMLFPVVLFLLPDFPTRMSLSVCKVPSSPRSPGSIKRR